MLSDAELWQPADDLPPAVNPVGISLSADLRVLQSGLKRILSALSRVHMGTCIRIESGSIPFTCNPVAGRSGSDPDQVDRARLKMDDYIYFRISG